MQDWLSIWELINIIHQISRKRSKDMLSSQYTLEKYFTKSNTHLWLKILSKKEIKRKFLKLIKGIYIKPIADIILKNKTECFFPKVRNNWKNSIKAKKKMECRHKLPVPGMKGGTIAYPTDIERIINDNTVKFCANKSDNFNEIDRFLKDQATKITQKEIDNTNSLIKVSKSFQERKLQPLIASLASYTRFLRKK